MSINVWNVSNTSCKKLVVILSTLIPLIESPRPLRTRTSILMSLVPSRSLMYAWVVVAECVCVCVRAHEEGRRKVDKARTAALNLPTTMRRHLAPIWGTVAHSMVWIFFSKPQTTNNNPQHISSRNGIVIVINIILWTHSSYHSNEKQHHSDSVVCAPHWFFAPTFGGWRTSFLYLSVVTSLIYVGENIMSLTLLSMCSTSTHTHTYSLWNYWVLNTIWWITYPIHLIEWNSTLCIVRCDAFNAARLYTQPKTQQTLTGKALLAFPSWFSSSSYT